MRDAAGCWARTWEGHALSHALPALSRPHCATPLPQLHAALASRHGELLPEERVWEAFVQVADALRYVHASNVLHRDIKSTNILLTGRPPEYRVVKLGDFGIAKVLADGRELAATVVGTPFYLSPGAWRVRRARRILCARAARARIPHAQHLLLLFFFSVCRGGVRPGVRCQVGRVGAGRSAVRDAGAAPPL